MYGVAMKNRACRRGPKTDPRGKLPARDAFIDTFSHAKI